MISVISRHGGSLGTEKGEHLFLEGTGVGIAGEVLPELGQLGLHVYTDTAPHPLECLPQAQPAGASCVPGVPGSPGPLNPCSHWGGAGGTPGGQESQCTRVFSRTKAKRNKFLSHFILRRTKIVIKTSTLLSRY